MTQLELPAVARTTVPTRWDTASGRIREVAPGLVVAGGVAGVATALAPVAPLLGAPVLALLLGAVAAAVAGRWPAGAPGCCAARLRPGLTVAARPVLQLAIVVFGATLSLTEVAAVGRDGLPVMLGTLGVALLGAWGLGRLLRVGGDTQVLIGVGTAICGASAIAATQSVLRARDAHVAYALGTILVGNVVAVLALPPLGHLLGMDGAAFGLWAGTAINDTSSVVAAGYAYGGDAGPHAVVVKLTRSLMIIPVVLGVALWVARSDGSAPAATPRRPTWTKLVPLFLLGFLATSALTTVGVIPTGWHDALTTVGTFLLSTALAGLGLALRAADLRAAGVRPLLFGLSLWVLVGSSALALQYLTAA